MDERIIKTIIPQAVAGDRYAFVEIYEITKDYVYRTVHFLLIDKNEVDDVVQEIYINLFKSLKKFDTSLPFRPWITGIIMKKIQDARRNRWKLTRMLHKVFASQQPIVPSIAELIETKQLYSHLLEQIEGLTPKLKEVILLRYVHDFSQEEVAKILSIPLGTVKSRINSALQKLRNSETNKMNIALEEGTTNGF